jgi:hypothetical protein
MKPIIIASGIYNQGQLRIFFIVICLVKEQVLRDLKSYNGNPVTMLNISILRNVLSEDFVNFILSMRHPGCTSISVKLSLCLTKHYAMRTYGWRVCIDPSFLVLGINCM